MAAAHGGVDPAVPCPVLQKAPSGGNFFVLLRPRERISPMQFLYSSLPLLWTGEASLSR